MILTAFVLLASGTFAFSQGPPPPPPGYDPNNGSGIIIDGTLGHRLTESGTQKMALAKVKIGPNPFSRQLTLTQTVDTPDVLTIILYDFKGHIVRSDQMSEMQTATRWHTSELPAGMYWILMKDSAGNARIEKLVKVN